MAPRISVMTMLTELCSTARESWRKRSSACLRSVMSSMVASVCSGRPAGSRRTVMFTCTQATAPFLQRYRFSIRYSLASPAMTRRYRSQSRSRSSGWVIMGMQSCSISSREYPVMAHIRSFTRTHWPVSASACAMPMVAVSNMARNSDSLCRTAASARFRSVMSTATPTTTRPAPGKENGTLVVCRICVWPLASVNRSSGMTRGCSLSMTSRSLRIKARASSWSGR